MQDDWEEKMNALDQLSSEDSFLKNLNQELENKLVHEEQRYRERVLLFQKNIKKLNSEVIFANQDKETWQNKLVNERIEFEKTQNQTKIVHTNSLQQLDIEKSDLAKELLNVKNDLARVQNSQVQQNFRWKNNINRATDFLKAQSFYLELFGEASCKVLCDVKELQLKLTEDTKLACVGRAYKQKVLVFGNVSCDIFKLDGIVSMCVLMGKQRLSINRGQQLQSLFSNYVTGS